jgi:hypothetical protein
MDDIKLQLPYWKNVCKSLSKEKVNKLKRFSKKSPNKCLMDSFDFDGDANEFSKYIDSLPKYKVCEYLSKYFVLSKCKNLSSY